MDSDSANVHLPRSILFLHIYKSGGSTVYEILRHWYGRDSCHEIDGFRLPQSVDDFKQLSEEERNRIRVLMGHQCFGLHKYLPKPYTYFTIMRKPIDRVLSHYVFIMRRPHDLLYDQVRAMSMEEYAIRTANLATRFISGWGRESAMFEDYCPPGMLEVAKDNIRRHFSAVGVLEKFDRFLFLLASKLQMPVAPYKWINVNLGRNRAEEMIEPSELRIIEKHNELDLELYDFVDTTFEEQISQLDGSLDGELVQFKDELIAYLQRELWSTQTRLDGVLNSRSWQWTRPLRVGLRSIERLRTLLTGRDT